MNRTAILALLTSAAILYSGAARSALGVVDVSLNVFPDSFANPDLGGSWTLIAKTDNPFGIAAIVVDLVDVDNWIGPDSSDTTDDAITLADDIGAINPVDEGGANERPPYLAFGNMTELLYGQDISDAGSVVIEVGTISTNDGPDPLGRPEWDVHTLIASGTYAGVVPQITNADANELGGISPPFMANDDGQTTWVTDVAVPEPGAAALVVIAVAGLALRRRS